jgi:tellurite resistance protein
MPRKTSRNAFANGNELDRFLDDAIRSVETDRETHGVRAMGYIIEDLKLLPRAQAVLAVAHLVQGLEGKSNNFIRLLELEAGLA